MSEVAITASEFVRNRGPRAPSTAIRSTAKRLATAFLWMVDIVVEARAMQAAARETDARMHFQGF